jgi:2-dehydrotetronate isomerase
MPKFAANLSFLYNDLPFEGRFAAAAADGFKGVEYLFPYGHSAAVLAQLLHQHGLTQVLFNTPAGGTDARGVDAAWTQGQRGTAALPGREAEFEFGLQLALDCATALGCTQVHAMAGVLPSNTQHADAHRIYLRNLHWACERAAGVGVTLLIEPINARDMPGYFLNTQAQAHAVLAEVNAPNLKVQMDLYHAQVSEGDLSTKLREYLPTGRVAHVQIAGVPERQEPNLGELNHPHLFELIDSLGYSGWVGCEYRPRLGAQAGGTSAGLGWMKGAKEALHNPLRAQTDADWKPRLGEF